MIKYTALQFSVHPHCFAFSSARRPMIKNPTWPWKIGTVLLCWSQNYKLFTNAQKQPVVLARILLVLHIGVEINFVLWNALHSSVAIRTNQGYLPDIWNTNARLLRPLVTVNINSCWSSTESRLRFMYSCVLLCRCPWKQTLKIRPNKPLGYTTKPFK